MPKIKNIIFDLGGVLLDIDYNRTRLAFEALGIKDFDQLYSQASANHLFQRLEMGTIEVPDFFNELNQCTGLSLTDEEIINAWNAMLLDFRESSLQYLIPLKQKAQLLLLSNTNIIHKQAFDLIYSKRNSDISFEDHFHHCIFSYETGTRKPDANCYRWTLAKAHLRPEETIFIDDSPQNVAGANAVGIKGMLLENNVRIEDIELEQWL